MFLRIGLRYLLVECCIGFLVYWIVIKDNKCYYLNLEYNIYNKLIISLNIFFIRFICK